MNAIKILGLGLALLTLHACTLAPQKLDVTQERQHALQQLHKWQAQGKLGLRVRDDAHSAYFDWRSQRVEAFSLRLSGPFGQGTTWLRRKGAIVTLEAPDQPQRRATSAEQLMQRQLGWQVPVSNLRYWIKGLAAPDHEIAHLARNPNGTLAELRQQGWLITYSDYDRHNGWVLPGRLVAQRGPIKLTLIIKQWQLPAAPHNSRP